MSDFSAWIEKNKTLWTRVYDEVIAPDLEEEWTKREERHNEELRQKDENQQILFKHVSNEVVKNAHLAAENEQLKKQMQGWHHGPAVSPGQETTVTAESIVSEDELRRLTDKYNELSKKYQDVSQKVKYLERKNNTVMQKNRDMKDSVRAWQEYADRQSGKLKPKSGMKAEVGLARPSTAVHHFQDDRPHFPSSPVSVATIRTPRSLADIDRSSPPPLLPLPHPLAESAVRLSSPRLDAGDDGRGSSASITPKPRGAILSTEQQVQTYLQPTNPTSSQTTEDESIDSANRHPQVRDAADKDDFPQFVSTRSLKRKRDQSLKSKFEIFADRSSDGTSAKPFRVKEEPPSSPPTNSNKLLRTETFDLDSPAPKVLQTPRHPRRKPSIEPDITGMLHQQRSNSEPFTQDINREKGRLTVTDVPGFDAGVDGTHVAPAEVRAISEPSHLEDVLRPLDPNILGSAFEETPSKRSRLVKRKGAHDVFAESGDEHPPMDENELRLPPHLARAQINRRLDSSANAQTPAKGQHHIPKAGSAKVKLEQMLTPPSSTAQSVRILSKDRESRSISSKARSKAPKESVLDDRPIWTMKAPETRSSARKDRTSPSKQGRLRDKPVTQLHVQDFKPNPAYNQGYSYAFSETVRKRGDRMCLPGCTNPQCCGSTFRILAEAQAPLSPSQEETVLEDYLGDAYNNMRLTQMSSEERNELVLQARTRKMAKETGKHREAYEGRRTPPGFWRVDFPTTQEQEVDRERAKEQEKKIVQERWLEAQRRGGKWIFRDE
ncbi:hypothetical protein N0V83_005494 [Neocucurbitaria cava]|uniref:DNA endonuclease activator Ctp1 C-terminal domain-containing protein n=1 Tax=Neocucurbitaria cava TaxID=798079 RepID=A0A9W9CM51_9PLEO|nr:hypothetical protein N0V83_005494 [Neocucurbitaria cava]